MTVQPRHPAEVRRSNEPVGGRWASKTVPDVDNQQVRFENTSTVGEPHDWRRRVVLVGDVNVRAVFKRTVNTDGNGNKVTTITTDCDPPDMLLLARKGDDEYWNGDVWKDPHSERRTWIADIAVNMLREGLVATGYGRWMPDGLDIVMSAHSDTQNTRRNVLDGPHILTYAIAQLRSLRLLQSMAPDTGWNTTLAGHPLPDGAANLLKARFNDAVSVYNRLPQPPWDDGVPWGPQEVAGHATNQHGRDVFVGENSDLLWRVLTGTDHYGRSPLKQGLLTTGWRSNDMTVAAALYDETAQYQLTHGLFDGVTSWYHSEIHDRTRRLFGDVLIPTDGESRWTPEQQERIRGFIDIVEALKP